MRVCPRCGNSYCEEKFDFCPHCNPKWIGTKEEKKEMPLTLEEGKKLLRKLKSTYKAYSGCRYGEVEINYKLTGGDVFLEERVEEAQGHLMKKFPSKKAALNATMDHLITLQEFFDKHRVRETVAGIKANRASKA